MSGTLQITPRTTLGRSSRSGNPEVDRLHKAIAHTVDLIGSVRNGVTSGLYTQKDVSTLETSLEILYQRLLGQLKIAIS